MVGWMVLDVEMFPDRSLDVKTDGHRDDHPVHLKASDWLAGASLYQQPGMFQRHAARLLFCYLTVCQCE